MITIRTAKKIGFNLLTQKGSAVTTKIPDQESNFIKSPSPFLDIDCILENILQVSRTFLLLHADKELSTIEESQFLHDIQLRRTGLPVAYITGHKEFYGLDFFVNPDVLIPKPDTETLIEHALSNAVQANKNINSSKPYFIADICTGSGCIAITMVHELFEQFPEKNIFMSASDISEKALFIAKKNENKILNTTNIPPAKKYNKIKFYQGDLFAAFPSSQQKFNMILSNPPYIPASMVTELLQDGRREPRLALDGDRNTTTNGIGIIQRLIPQVFQHLANKGFFLVETGEYNAEETAALFKKQGFSNIIIHKDLAGHLRVVEGTKKAD